MMTIQFHEQRKSTSLSGTIQIPDSLIDFQSDNSGRDHKDCLNNLKKETAIPLH